MNHEPSNTEDYSFSMFAGRLSPYASQWECARNRRSSRSVPHLEEEIRKKLPALLILEKAIGRADGIYPTVDTNKPVGGCYIGEEIARGACGIVFRGYQPDLDREVAIKVIRIRATGNKDRFELERHALARLEHPHIVPAYSFVEEESQAYLVMKLIDGYSVSQLLREDCDYKGTVQLSLLRSDWVDCQTCLSHRIWPEHAHENGLIHRDIKPSNLMLDRTGHVWITDFGLAKMNDFPTR